MEEKKKRPRLTKPDTGFSLKERPKTYHPDKEDGSEENFDRPRYQDRDRDNDGGGNERKPYQDRDRNDGGGYERKPYYNKDRNEGGGGYERKPYQNRDNQGGGGGYERKPYQNRDNQGGGGGYERRPYQNRDNQGGGGGYERRPYQNRDNQGGGGGYERKPYQNRDNQGGGGGYERRPYQNRDNQGGGGGYERRPYQNRDNQGGGGGYERRPYQNRDNQGGGGGFRKPFNKGGGGGGFKKRRDDFQFERKPKPTLPSGVDMPLNKYLAHCGVASRRKAVDFIDQGLITINGEVKKEPYYRIQEGDVVMCQGKQVQVQERMVYVLLNKPKNVITTTDDERNRTTVIDIVDGHFPERLYPVGRLDRDTTGLILITNDGDLAQKLSHPSHHVMKQYRVGLNRPLTHADQAKIEQGIELEDGLMEVNWIRFSEDHPDRDVVEVEITSGRNRVIRRLFESLGYDVRKLDRFYFAGLTKKELPRGSFRELTQREIVMLKHFTGHPSTNLATRKRPEGFDEAEDAQDDNFEDGQEDQ